MTGDGLDVRELRVTYPGKPPRVAVAGASFRVSPGGSLALVGASGSGKSSILLAIAGVIASEGVVAWDGQDLAAIPTHKRGIGLVFQDGQLFPHLTVAGNIGFGLEMKHVGRVERNERIAELLAMVGLEGMEARPVTQLSGGERQRIALARTLAPRPRLVLPDEPLSSLDADLRARLAVEVREVLEASGAAWIVVTHDRAEADAMADRVQEMSFGHLAPNA
jgi:thiamine transport system ATP-binding protein